MPKLSILIATIPFRELQLQELIENLHSQGGDVEILVDGNMGYNVGRKRNLLLERATGEYIVFVDDDDEVSEDYIPLILGAIKSKPDCVGTSGIITINGDTGHQWHISRRFKKWYEKDGVYFRTPNHISPVRRDIALKAKFKEIAFGEDFDYSMRILHLLKTEVVIKENIYTYNYVEKSHC